MRMREPAREEQTRLAQELPEITVVFTFSIKPKQVSRADLDIKIDVWREF